MAQELMSSSRRSRRPPPATSPASGAPFRTTTSASSERGGARGATPPRRRIAPTDDQHHRGRLQRIEPIFALVLHPQTSWTTHLVEVHPLFDAEMRRRGLYSVERMTDSRRWARSGTWSRSRGRRPGLRHAARHLPEAHLRMQAAFQSTPKTRVSKTVNFPSDATRDDIRKVFVLGLPPRLQGRHRLPGQEPRRAGP